MKKQNLYFWCFLAPALFAFIMVMIVPFFLGVYYSLTDWDGIRANPTFIGLINYKTAFAEDPRFVYSIIITLMYSLFSILIINSWALFLALLVTQKLKLQKLYRAGFFIPNLIGGLILGYIWQFIFDRALPSLLSSILTNDFLMLANRNTALFAIIIAGTWQYGGYIMVIFITAIQNIPTSMLEAAKIDGASSWNRFKHITLPMIAPAITITTFLTLLYSFKQFDVNYSLTYGGPATMFQGKAINGTELLSMNIFRDAFDYQKMGPAQAKSVLFFMALLIFSLLQVYSNKKKEVEA